MTLLLGGLVSVFGIAITWGGGSGNMANMIGALIDPASVGAGAASGSNQSGGSGAANSGALGQLGSVYTEEQKFASNVESWILKRLGL